MMVDAACSTLARISMRALYPDTSRVEGLPVPTSIQCPPLHPHSARAYLAQGSKNMSYDAINLTTPDIKWLGVRPSDLDKYNIPQQCRCQVSDTWGRVDART